MAAGRRAAIVAALIVTSVSLAGCVTSASAPLSPSAPPGAASAPLTTAPAASPTRAPTLVAGGTAQENKAYFDAVNTRLFATTASANGRSIIDNLVAAGFDKASMQVTPDRTSINGSVDSILFSVKIGTMCLLGQHGGGGYSSAVEAALTSGVCLIGKTRVIDW
jgi:cell division septation protein DedD